MAGAATRSAKGVRDAARTPFTMYRTDGESVYWPSSAASRASMARAPESELAIE